MKYYISFIIFLLSIYSEARVFNFKNENLAVLFNASGTMSLAENNAFANSSGSATVFSSTDKVQYNPAFELGFLFIPSPGFTVATSMQVLQTQQVVAIGKNAGGTDLFTVTSDVFVMNPRISFEFELQNTGVSRFYFHLGGGYSDASMDNQYVFSGLVLTDFTEKAGVYEISYTGGLGYETLFSDNVTFNLDLGYRQLNLTGLTHKHAYTTINGAVTSGSAVLNNDNSKRSVNMGGLYVGVGFRFYINIY